MTRLPDLEEPRRLRAPEQSEQTLSNGLTVIAIRQPGVPLMELRLGVPFAQVDPAQGTLLTRCLLSGTHVRSSADLTRRLATVGAELETRSNPDRLKVNGSGLVAGLRRTLGSLAEILEDAAYPEDEVNTERDRLAAQLEVRLKQSAHQARMALREMIYRDHPYRLPSPSADEVRAVQAEQLRDLHKRRLNPDGAALVLVGHFDPDAVLGEASRCLSGWAATGETVDLPPAPPVDPGPPLLVDRPGSFQSSLRLALPAVTRIHPEYPALQLANLVFGGYFSSRWTENLRERKGYSYGPHSRIDHSAAGSTVVAAAEVSTEVTAAALAETFGELDRMVCLPPGDAEIDQARRYALGALLITMSDQRNLAGLAAVLAGFGLRLDHIVAHAERLRAVTAAEVLDAARTYLAPTGAATLVLGDVDRIADEVAAVTPLGIRRAP